MSMSVGAGSTGDEDEGGGSTLADINVTPLVDVMLVLLVIFMVTAPLINQAGVDVDLPAAHNGAVKQEQTESAIVSVDKGGNVYLDDRKFTPDEFATKFTAVIKARNPKAVFLRADKSVPYGTVMQVMDELRIAGIAKLGMMTVPSGTETK